MEEVSAPEYSRLFDAPRFLLEKSLAVLKIAREALSVDGLTPGEVSEILIQKFRVPRVHTPNVRAALRDARAYASRVAVDGGHRYLLMANGESHLKETVRRLASPGAMPGPRG
jgi:hypothetical protein